MRDFDYDSFDNVDFDDMTDDEIELMSAGGNASKVVKMKNSKIQKRPPKKFKDINRKYK